MKRYSLLLPVAAMLMMASCDKIAEGEYTVYAGINATWSDGSGVQSVQRAYVEKYTGPSCINCPKADTTIDLAHQQLGERLVAVSINHPDGMGTPYPGEPDMRTDDGNAWDSYFGIVSIPSAYLNRNTDTRYRSSMLDLISDLQSCVGEAPVVGIEVTATQQGERGISIAVDMQFEQSYNAPMTLTLALTEDSLCYKQLTPNDGVVEDYAHNHMLRDVLTDVWGAEVEATGNQGEKRHAQFATYTVKDASIQLRNCHVVAFLSDRQSKRVLNSAQCTIALTAEE